IDELLPRRWRGFRQEAQIEDPVVRQEIDRAQRVVEGQNLEIRRTLWKYEGFLEQQRVMVAERRHALLEGTAESLFAELEPEKYERLQALLGSEALRDLERRIRLVGLDRAWADHLGRMAELRDGIHLVSLGRRSPLEEFQRAAIESFGTFEQDDAQAVEVFRALEVGEGGLDLAKKGLLGPSATWTCGGGASPSGPLVGGVGGGLKRVLGDRLKSPGLS